MDFEKKSSKKERYPSPSGSFRTGGQKSFWTSGTLTVVHPGVEAFVACVRVRVCERVCARTWLFLLAKLHLETCNLEGLTVSRGRDGPPSQKIIITCRTKHGSRVMEEHQCLRDQGPADAEGCIRADPADTPSLSRLKHPYMGIGGSGPKLFTTLCRHEEEQLWRFFLFFFFTAKKVVCSRGKKKQTYTLFCLGFLLRLFIAFPVGRKMPVSILSH